MDSRLHNPSEHEGFAFQGDPSFSSDHKVGFDEFFPPATQNAFGVQWPAGNFATPQDAVNGYGPAAQTWPENPPQNTTSLSTSNFAGNPNQVFSRVPGAYEYPNFESRPTTALSNPTFDSPLGFAQVSSNIDPRLSFGSPQQTFQPAPNQHQTVSPQALQNYPNAYDAVNAPATQKAQTSRAGAVATQTASAVNNVPRQRPLTKEAWNSMSSKLPPGKNGGMFSLRDVESLSTSTSGRRLHGFALISRSNVEVETGKITHVRVNKRRSKTEVRKLLLDEKGTGPWNPARGPILKKLKVSATRSATARSGAPAGRTPTTPESTSPTESSSDSESDDGSKYDSEPEPESPPEPSPLPGIRPKDPGEAAEYDVVEAVWAPRKGALTADRIRASLTKYWAVIKTIRDKWKAHGEALKEAEEAKDMAKFSKSKRLIDEQRRVLDSCIRSTLRYGHHDIVNRLGGNPLMLVILCQFLQERIKEGEYGGSFIAGILELLARWTSVDQATLEKTKVDKILPKLIKKGDLQGKALAQQILDSAANPVKPSSMTAKVAGSIQRPASATNASKSLTNDVKASLLAKKDAAVTASPQKPLTATQIKKQLLDKKSKPGLKPVTAAAPPVRVKTNHIAAKPSSMFASLQSASKKPGSTVGLKGKEGSNGNAADRKEPPATSKSTAAPSKPSFSFAETMANLNKAKEKTPEMIEVDQPPETEEQRKKRLRKEERRKLRVSFKGDEDLVQVKLFMHDPEEELGHDDSMTRDVGDTRGEGQMLKMHKELEDLDDEEEYAPEEPLAEWILPISVDFGDIDPQERGRNFETRGGKKIVDSKHAIEQGEREKNTLMVIYTSEADIPPSPREPSGDHDGESNTEQGWGDPPELVRQRESTFTQKQQASTQGGPGAAVFDTSKISDLLATLRGDHPQQQPEPAPQAPTSNLEALFAQFSANQPQNAQVAPPQVQMSQMQAPQMSQHAPPVPGVDIQAIMASFANPSHAPQPPQQQQTPYPASFPIQNPPDIQSLLAQFGQQNAQQQQIQNYGSYNGNSFLQQDDNDSRKRQFDDDGNFGLNKGKKQKFGAPKKPFNGVPILPCKFWQEGKCLKGDDCTFVHGPR